MQARRLPARAGAAWLQSAYALYRRNPPLLTSITMLYLMVVIGFNFLPVIGAFIVPLLLPSLNLVIGNTCRLIASGAEPSREALFENVRAQRPQLLRLGAMQLGASVLLLLVSLLIEGGIVPMPDADKPDLEGFVGMLLRLAVLAVPLLLAFWFASLLTGWDRLPAGKAVFFSFVACWRNLRVFFVYVLCVGAVAVFLPGLLMALVMLVAPDLLGTISFVLRTLLIVVLTPILMASVYISYQDVFHISEQVE